MSKEQELKKEIEKYKDCPELWAVTGWKKAELKGFQQGKAEGKKEIEEWKHNFEVVGKEAKYNLNLYDKAIKKIKNLQEAYDIAMKEINKLRQILYGKEK